MHSGFRAFNKKACFLHKLILFTAPRPRSVPSSHQHGYLGHRTLRKWASLWPLRDSSALLRPQPSGPAGRGGDSFLPLLAPRCVLQERASWPPAGPQQDVSHKQPARSSGPQCKGHLLSALNSGAGAPLNSLTGTECSSRCRH